MCLEYIVVVETQRLEKMVTDRQTRCMRFVNMCIRIYMVSSL